MPRSGAAVTPTRRDGGIDVLAGDAEAQPHPRPLFDRAACRLLESLGAALRLDDRARRFPDLQTFAFWCRPANINRLKATYEGTGLRLGRGLIFHIAPANVPVNAAYTFAFGLLAGNANIVRLPSRASGQIEVFCTVLGRLLDDPEHAPLKRSTAFIRYPHDIALTESLSARCHGRMIWGGDETIRTLRQIPLPPRAVELTFADRYSFCVLQSDAVLAASDLEMKRLVELFYNDTYAMDQNACSSPHLVLWHGRDAQRAKDRFWTGLAARVAARYELAASHAVEKYTRLLDAALGGAPHSLRRHENHLYVLGVDDIDQASSRLRGRFGLFYEKDITSLDVIFGIATASCQTLTYYGLGRQTFCDLMLRHAPIGIDRIVPVGRALDIDVIWDGCDIIRSLSRLVDVT